MKMKPTQEAQSPSEEGQSPDAPRKLSPPLGAFLFETTIPFCWSLSVLFLAPETIKLAEREAASLPTQTGTGALLIKINTFLIIKVTGGQEFTWVLGKLIRKLSTYCLEGKNEAAKKRRTR